MPKQQKPVRAITLRIALRGSKPEIWRRVQVTTDMTLSDLHQVIQAAMGWTNSHLHDFDIAGERYSMPIPGEDPDDDDLLGFVNESKVRLADVIKRKGQKFDYIYDFGDNWHHRLVVEAIEPVNPAQHYPVCLAGKRACPVEDSGSIYGYYSKLQIIKNPKHEYHDEIAEWMPPNFDPDAFDLDEVNDALKDFRNYLTIWDIE